jgi:endonuclease/exonuclease/phosphatase family metal-dependent hydrolase
MRVVTYNILDGGVGRLDGLADTLARLRPDFTGICEAEVPDNIADLAGKLSQQHIVAEARDGKHHVALITRLPIERMVNLSAQLRAMSRGALEAVLNVDGRRIRMIVAHLTAGQNAGDEPQRFRELSALLEWLDEEDEPLPTLMMGDFNAAAPYHPFDYNGSSPRVKQRLANRSTHMLDHDVIRLMMERGWTDTLLHTHPENHTHTYTTEYPCSRFDYIWASDELRASIRDAGVETGGFTRTCSDHYPVWAELG